MQAGDRKTKRNANRRNANRRDAHHPWGMFVLAATIATICGMGLLELVNRAASISPRVGDIIAFSPERPIARDVAARLAVERPGSAICVLDVSAMRQSGGSLIVEERQPARNPVFRVHWSGLRTTGDDRNCGADADLVLRASDLEVLALGAGGYGVPGQRLAASTVRMNPATAVP
ncbi:MAG: hypothetical protein P4L71_06325 [Acetobacteraceae bacterium]|nr:hypothetical protein [Acetobacteraceae bacterium]